MSEFNYRNAAYNADGTIDCEAEHPEYGWIFLTAGPDDIIPAVVKLFRAIEANGDATPYTPE